MATRTERANADALAAWATHLRAERHVSPHTSRAYLSDVRQLFEAGGVSALRPCRHRDPMLSTGSERNKVSLPLIRRDGSVLTLSVLAFVLLVACGPDASTPQGTAERFLDAHYVRIDLRNALPFTSGLARHKVEDELRLVEGQPIDAATRKPTVHYRLLETRPDGEHAVNFLYLGSITVEDADRFERRWMVTVRREADGWRVTNYQELGG